MATRRELEENSFLYGGNGAYIEEMFSRYLTEPSSVDESWRGYFDRLDPETRELFEQSRTATRPKRGGVIGGGAANQNTRAQSGDVESVVRDHIRMIQLIRAYRVRGHLLAELDPLQLEKRPYHPELDYKTYGFSDDDLNREFYLDGVLGMERASLRTINATLRKTYASNVAVEYLHIQDPEQKIWLQRRIESAAGVFDAGPEQKREILEHLTETEGFEAFLHVKFPGTKRFGLDGGESAIPCLETIIQKSGELGVEEVVIGMPHRGRLNVLANVMGKPYSAIFSEFQGGNMPDDVQGSGDVKYHLGTSTDRVLANGRQVHLSLTANPSHLEAVNPVVQGKVRAKQRQKGDKDRSKVMGLLLHGDAAFAGQGVVHECLEMSQLKGYRTGGTIHLIVNNQIGFTTTPAHARTSPYPSDVARAVQAPIFHVNGDDPVAVTRVAALAAEFRQVFKTDVVIDMWCYRRHGHNEGDEPSFTQPLMYKAIAKHPTVRQVYAQRLAKEGIASADESQAVWDKFHRQLDEAHQAANAYKSNDADWLTGAWSGLDQAPAKYDRGVTGVGLETLRDLGMRMTDIEGKVAAHRKLTRVINQRRKAIEAGEGIDWATAEHLAFATLLTEGFPVRLSGQDVGRGTFSQRHAVITDQETDKNYVPLQNLKSSQASFEIVNSFLSEEGVLGFEYGYSLADPNCLTLWEAQFGDFANGAQVYFDQFISSGESKWLRMSGLVCLLPHGMEGQGPEHSSARLERFLQLYAENNIIVAQPTTPASLFHVLRRQLHRKFRKPLIIMEPKSLLRHKMCVSDLDEFGPEWSFHRVLWDRPPSDADKKVERVILCSGKVYYDLRQKADEAGVGDKVALLRLEQLAPFPEQVLGQELARFPNDAKYVWCQDEPRNQGSWFFVAPRIENLMEAQGVHQKRMIYAGRKPAASPATGFAAQHAAEQKKLVEEALGLAPASPGV